MIPVLFSYDTPVFDSFETGGIGRLYDAISCFVTEAYADSSYEYTLEMQYPVTGEFFEDLNTYNIIVVTPSPDTERQAFRIRKVTRPLNGIVTVYANHISYDLDNYPVYMTASKTGAAAAIAAVGTATRGVTNPFTFSTDIADDSTVMPHPDGPVTARQLLLMEDGVQDTFGGEWLFNNGTVSLRTSRGVDNGVTLRRGKNITDLEQNEDTEESFSGIFPFYKGGDEYVTLSEYVLTLDEAYIDAIAIVDLSKSFKSKPSESQLRAKAQKYLQQHIKAEPNVSTSVDFIPLSQTLEYADIAAMEAVHLYDTVHVVYGTLNINVRTKVCKTVYNVLLDRYESVDLGAVKQNIYQAVKRIATKTAQSYSGGSSGGGGGSGGTTDYNDLTNKPQIEGVTLSGDKSYDALNLLSLTNTEIENICT